MSPIQSMVRVLLDSPGWKPERQEKKECGRCHEAKELHAFPPSASICRACHVILTREWKSRNK